MAYAISEEDAASAPKPLEGEDAYVREMYLKGRKYFLYVHRLVSCYGFFYLMFLQFFFFLSYQTHNLLYSKMFIVRCYLPLLVCSYLHYGLLAARAEILKVSEDSSNPCIVTGHDGERIFFPTRLLYILSSPYDTCFHYCHYLRHPSSDIFYSLQVLTSMEEKSSKRLRCNLARVLMSAGG